MNEEFLYYLWKFRLLYPELITVQGESLVILHPGERNTDSGPDFLNARLRIGKTVWAGNVEIHIHASDWFKHRHQDDPAYNNIILHVVYENDLCIKHENKFNFPTLVVKNQFPHRISDNYQSLMLNKQWIPCYNQIINLKDPVFLLWSPGLTIDRLRSKSEVIDQIWESCQKDWEETFYRYLSMNFGFKINSLPFELLAKSLPLRIIRQHVHHYFQLEALLYGQAGMLERKSPGDYPTKLASEYSFLRQKYGLNPIPVQYWKFLRLRPSNFPTLRISQWAEILHRNKGFFFPLMAADSLMAMKTMLNVNSSKYWNDHYTFDKTSVYQVKLLGDQSVNLLIINGIVPFMFNYGEKQSQPLIKEKAIRILEQLPAEENSLISKWEKTGINSENALQTQALIELKHSYCEKKICLHCRIGNALLAAKEKEI